MTIVHLLYSSIRSLLSIECVDVFMKNKFDDRLFHGCCDFLRTRNKLYDIFYNNGLMRSLSNV
jgi:hypothetical protein